MNQKHRFAQAKCIALLVGCILHSHGSKAALSDEEVQGYAACQAWSSAVFKSPQAFTEEWRAWSMAVMSTAIASPMNDDWSPFKNDQRFVELVRKHRAEFAKEPESSTSPSYVRAHAICMNHLKTRKPNPPFEMNNPDDPGPAPHVKTQAPR